MKLTKKQLEEIKAIEKKVAQVCDAINDEITGIPYPTPDEPMNNESTLQEQNITLRGFLALCFADVDIFLLQDESQENDNDKLYTKEEIRNQLKLTMAKMTNLPFVFEGLYDIDLFQALGHKFLLKSGFSEKNIKSFT